MRARARRRLLSGIVGASLLAALAAAPPVQLTDAAFTDSEYASGTLKAATLLAPQIAVPMPLCQRPPLVGTGDLFTIKWKWPVAGDHTEAFNASLRPANIRWRVNATDNVAVPSSGPDSNGFYTTTFNSGLLGSLLGSLLGVNVVVEMRTIIGSWTSQTVSRMTYNAPTVAGVSCTVANAPLP